MLLTCSSGLILSPILTWLSLVIWRAFSCWSFYVFLSRVSFQNRKEDYIECGVGGIQYLFPHISTYHAYLVEDLLGVLFGKLQDGTDASPFVC